jgi:catechol 2,3-dioxygenase-like lactoylglutathione lyase family enzyme
MQVSRATFYRHWRELAPKAQEADLRDRLQQIALSERSYGYRRITAALRREGFVVNHKRVARILRQDNLLAVRRKRFVVTTDGRHTWRLWPNLARWMRPNGPNQLWVSDITYLRLRSEFCYLAVILDAWSRRVVGWCLRPHLNTNVFHRAATCHHRPWPPPARSELARPFLPTKDFELSKRFYETLGFEKLLDGEVAIFAIGSSSFLLQNYYQEDWAANFMMQLMVDDLDSWWRFIEELDLPRRFGVAAPKPPALQPWGLRIAYVVDPAGVLWHVAERRPGDRSDLAQARTGTSPAGASTW